VLKRNSMRLRRRFLAALPALSPVRTQLWMPHPSIVIGTGLLPTESRRPRSDGLFDGTARSIRTG